MVSWVPFGSDGSESELGNREWVDGRGCLAPFWRERGEKGVTLDGVGNGNVQAAARCALGDGDNPGAVTGAEARARGPAFPPGRHVPCSPPHSCPLHLCLCRSPSDPAWASPGLGGSIAGDPLPLPRPSGLQQPLPEAPAQPRLSPGWGRRCDASNSSLHRSQRHCNAVLGGLLLIFSLKVLICQGNVKPDASRKGWPGGLGCVNPSYSGC